MSASPHARGRRGAQGRRRAWLRRLALASFAAGWLGIIGLVWPLAVHGQANDVSLLSSYGATASGWAIQPYIESDQFSTIPATDQSAPYVYTSIQGDIFPDGSTSETAKAKAAYVTAGTAPNAVLTQAGQAGAPSEQVPDGVEADYPGATGSASSSIGAVSDGVATQACAGGEQAQAAEATAQAYSTLASYRFAPSQLGALPSGCTPPALPGGVPTPPALPTLPPLPTPPALPTLPGGSGATPTATPSAGGGTGATPVPTATRAAPTPTATSCPLIICLGGQPQQAAYQPEVAAHTGASPVPVPLPDVVEQQLATALKAAELANPNLLALAGGKLAAPNLGLPYAAADISAQSAVQASNSGAQATLVVHGGHVELFQ